MKKKIPVLIFVVTTGGLLFSGCTSQTEQKNVVKISNETKELSEKSLTIDIPSAPEVPPAPPPNIVVKIDTKDKTKELINADNTPVLKEKEIIKEIKTPLLNLPEEEKEESALLPPQKEVEKTPAPPISVKIEEEKKPEVVEKKIGYKNGAYSQTGVYISPAGNETVGVKLVIEDGVITGVSVTPNATHNVSKKMQGLFAKGISTVIVGKKIENITNVAAVNGSSLTGGGFMNAVSKIKNEAKF